MERPTAAEHVSAPLDPKISAYLDELAADLAAHGQSGDMLKDMQQAHERRQAFALEMAEGKTERARMAREALQAVIYSRLVARRATQRCMAACEAISGWQDRGLD